MVEISRTVRDRSRERRPCLPSMSDSKLARRKEMGRLIRQRREAMVPKVTQTDVARHVLGSSDHQTIQKIENGDRGVSADELLRISEILDIDPRALVGIEAKRHSVPLFGDVGVGGEYYAHAGSGRWMEIKRVTAPLGDEAVNGCVRVEGKHLEGAGYWHGDLLFFKFPGDPVDEILGRRCIVQIRDGSAFVGVLTTGAHQGRYLLRSLIPGEATREVAVEWAARIRWHQQA